MRLLTISMLLAIGAACTSGGSDDTDTDVTPPGSDTRTLAVSVSHASEAPLTEVELLVYDTPGDCDGFTLVQDAQPSLDTPVASAIVYATAPGEFPTTNFTVRTDRANGRVTARARPADGAGGAQPYFIAGGCTHPQSGSDQVQIVLDVRWPDISKQNALEVTTTIAALPASIEPFADELHAWADSPGQALLRLLAFGAGGDRAWNEDPWSLMLECTDEDEGTGACSGTLRLRTFGIEAAAALGEALDDAVAGLDGAAGVDAAAAFSATHGVLLDDVTAIALHVDLAVDVPSPEGAYAGSPGVVLPAITWRTPEVDHLIQLGTTVSASAAGARVDWSETTTGVVEFTVTDLDLGFDYPTIAQRVADEVWVSRALGAEVVGFAGLMALLDCDDLGIRVEEATGNTSLASAIVDACELHPTNTPHALSAQIRAHDLHTRARFATLSECPSAWADGLYRVERWGSVAALCPTSGVIESTAGDAGTLGPSTWWMDRR